VQESLGDRGEKTERDANKIINMTHGLDAHDSDSSL
jgi:hypothetical protein